MAGRAPPRKPRAYRGQDPFAFVCYAHDDEQLVNEEMNRLGEEGFRFYFDEGITPGHTWHDELADAIERCSIFLLYITPHSANSPHCLRELYFALDLGKPIIAIHLERVDLSSGLRLAIGDKQAILAYAMEQQLYEGRLLEVLMEHMPTNLTSPADATGVSLSFDQVLAETLRWIERDLRVSYRAIKRRFRIDDEFLEDLKVELVEVQRVAVDENNNVLVHNTAASEPVPAEELEDRNKTEAPVQVSLRRHLTVMFIDILGSAEISSQLDPEDLRSVISSYHKMCSHWIRRYDGFIAQYLGSGILAYFGYPRAHEHDVQRAVHAGLATISGLHALNEQLETDLLPSIALRIGIHTGLVVIADIGDELSHDQLALGEAPDVATNIQTLAQRNTVTISQQTYELLHGQFETDSLGEHSLKGHDKPLSLYEVVGEPRGSHQPDVTLDQRKTPLVGRDREADLLAERWRQTGAGRGSVVLMSGDAGIGKSRLVQSLKEEVERGEVGRRFEFRCSAHHENTGLFPFIDFLTRTLDLRPDETPSTKLTKLQSVLATYTASVRDALPLFAELLDIPVPDSEKHPEQNSARRKRLMHENIVSWIIEESERQPVLVIFQDLHWADASTLDIAGMLIDQVATTPVLVIVTYRPDIAPPWPLRSHVTQLTLDRLEPSSIEELINHLAQGHDLPASRVSQLIARSDGVPLFAEELTKAVLASDSGLLESGPVPLPAIPATLRDSLMARLDRMGAARDVALLASTLGRHFSWRLIDAVSDLTSDNLEAGLNDLVDAEILFQRGWMPDVQYSFRHSLIQDSAYQSLLRVTRRAYHDRVATILIQEFPDTLPESLAHHLSAAGRIDEATRAWHRAGRHAAEQCAFEEAIGHLRAGLQLVDQLTPPARRHEHELALLTALGSALIATRGYASKEVQEAYERARKLCGTIGETPRLLQVLLGLQSYYVLRADLDIANSVAQECVRLAEQSGFSRSAAYYELGLAEFYAGDTSQSVDKFERAIDSYDPDIQTIAGLQDSAVGSLGHLASAQWLLGKPDQALTCIEQAVARARQLEDPFNLAMAYCFGGWARQLRRDVEATMVLADSALNLCKDYDFPFWNAMALNLKGWALVNQDEFTAGVRLMEDGLSAWQAIGTELSRSYWMTRLAEAYHPQDAARALKLVVEAMDLVDQAGERYFLPAMWCLRAELVAEQDPDLAFEHLEQANTLALERDTNGLLLQTRSIALRLARRTGRSPDTAKEQLAAVMGLFHEGLNTRDYREARALYDAS